MGHKPVDFKKIDLSPTLLLIFHYLSLSFTYPSLSKLQS